MCISKQWFVNNKDIISGLGTILGVVTAIVGFYFTIAQINRATSQLRAANEYTIRKDERQLIQQMDLKTLRACVNDNPTPCNEENSKRAKTDLGLLFNFNYSIYQQYRSGGISEPFKDQMATDFCHWLKKEFVKNFWEEQVKSGLYSEHREAMKKEWCR